MSESSCFKLQAENLTVFIQALIWSWDALLQAQSQELIVSWLGWVVFEAQSRGGVVDAVFRKCEDLNIRFFLHLSLRRLVYNAEYALALHCFCWVVDWTPMNWYSCQRDIPQKRCAVKMILMTKNIARLKSGFKQKKCVLMNESALSCWIDLSINRTIVKNRAVNAWKLAFQKWHEAHATRGDRLSLMTAGKVQYGCCQSYS